MQFHISFTIQSEQRDAAQARFLEAGAPPPEGFRTHGELFRKQTIISPYRFGMREERNEVALLAETDNLDVFLEVLGSPATAEAMALDGVNRDTVKLFALDEEFNE